MNEQGARRLHNGSFVVTPLEFPGGDIGRLAVCGTVNDLAVGGAQPLWLSAAFIIEEGFEISSCVALFCQWRKGEACQCAHRDR